MASHYRAFVPADRWGNRAAALGRTFDRQLDDVLALQGELAREVAGAVHAALTADERPALARRRSVDPETCELYLRGRQFWELRTEDSHRKSLGRGTLTAHKELLA